MYSARDPAFRKLLRRSIFLPICLMLLLLGVLSWLLLVTGKETSAINENLAAISQAEALLTLMVDYKDSWIGYRITHENAFLDQFNNKRLQIPDAIERLRAAAAGDAEQVERVKQVEQDFAAWNQFQSAAPTAKIPAQALPLYSNLQSDRVRGDVALLVMEERNTLSSLVEQQHSTALVLFFVLGGGAISVGAFLSYESWRTITTLSNRYERALQREREQANTLQKSNAELDRRVEERTRDLNAANRELEIFCYSAAHDLRSPLRWIIGTNRLFVEDYGHLIPQEGLEDLKRVSAAATRLSQLIDNLLEMARLGRVDVNNAEVDLSNICSQVVVELQGREWDGPVQVTIQPDIGVVGDPLLLSLLVQNLLENAFKFCSRGGHGHVEVSGREEGGKVTVRVHDNGVGFDEAWADKLFKPFERLHRVEEFQGTGMGLANAKRIVERHGGRIWAESKPGQGASFFFTLSAVKAKRPTLEKTTAKSAP